jgi:hypothetical protein
LWARRNIIIHFRTDKDRQRVPQLLREAQAWLWT